jgi:hypothetical protein
MLPPPDELPFPFHVVSNTAHLQDIDTSFSYQVHINNDESSALCNDIPCSVCLFSCKEGADRYKVLTDYAKEHFPEFLI